MEGPFRPPRQLPIAPLCNFRRQGYSDPVLPYTTTPTILAQVQPLTLVRWRPADESGLAVCREVWMPPELADRINERPWRVPDDLETERQTERRRRETISFLLSFILGDHESVGVGRARCDIKAMTPERRKVWDAWEFRIVPRTPHTRIFGAFHTCQDFVATSLYAKAEVTESGRNSQDNLGRVACNLARTICKGKLLEFRTAPDANDLGGSDLGYYDENG